MFEDLSLKVSKGGMFLYPEQDGGDGQQLAVGAPFTGLETSRTSTGLWAELPPDIEPGRVLDLAAVDTLYNRTRGRHMRFVSRHVEGSLRLASVHEDLETYQIEAEVRDPHHRDNDQPETISLVGDIVARRLKGATCRRGPSARELERQTRVDE